MKNNPSNRSQRGFTLIESMIAIVLLLVGSVGLMSLQIISSRTNAGATKIMQALALANDLTANIERWNYTDSRLNTGVIIADVTDPAVAAKWEMGTQATVPSAA